MNSSANPKSQQKFGDNLKGIRISRDRAWGRKPDICSHRKYLQSTKSKIVKSFAVSK